jgi:hypothetical protein
MVVRKTGVSGRRVARKWFLRIARSSSAPDQAIFAVFLDRLPRLVT